MKAARGILIVCIFASICVFGTGMFYGYRMADARSSKGGAMQVRRDGFSRTTVFRMAALTEAGAVVPELRLAARPATLLDSLTSVDVLYPVVRSQDLEREWELSGIDAIVRLRGLIDVHREADSGAVSLTVWSATPEQSAALANAVRDSYAAWRKEEDGKCFRGAAQVADERISQQAVEVEKAKAELAQREMQRNASRPEAPSEEIRGREISDYWRARYNYDSQLQKQESMKGLRRKLEDGTAHRQPPVEILKQATAVQR
ncbi:MAG TPA: hypothetical protein VG796_09905 [Verrucomicrobiales bacterium]|jgi:hypothetical protein|nr:hypothetical protein [Verrucomicrobiales bacterium]